MTRPALALITALATYFGCVGAARADVDEWAIIIEPSAGRYTEADKGHVAVGAKLELELGVSETAWLSVQIGALWAIDGPAIQTASLGLQIAFDVLRLVPFLNVATGVSRVKNTLSPSLSVGVGGDYFVTQYWTLGGVARARPIFGHGQSLTTGGVRLGYRDEL